MYDECKAKTKYCLMRQTSVSDVLAKAGPCEKGSKHQKEIVLILDFILGIVPIKSVKLNQPENWTAGVL